MSRKSLPEQLEDLEQEIRDADAKCERINDDMAPLFARSDLDHGEEQKLERLVAGGTKATHERDALKREYDKLTTLSRVMADPNSPNIVRGDAPQGPTLISRIDPWAAPNTMETPKEQRDRALAAVEHLSAPSDTNAAAADRLSETVRGEGGEAAEFVLAAGHPAYMRAFEKILPGPFGRMDWTDDEKRAWDRVHDSAAGRALASDSRRESRTALALSGSTAILPVQLDPQIHLTGSGARGDFRQFSRVVNTISNVWYGATSAGVTAEWTTEANEAADATPTVSQFSITPVRGDAYVQASYEVIQDTDFSQQLGGLFGDAKYVLEQAAFATGAGSTTAPEGIVTKLAGTTASRVSASTNASLGAVDCFALVNALPARWQDKAEWAGHWGIANLIRQFPGNNNSSFWTDLGGGTPPQLLGANFHQVSGMTSSLSVATASSDYVLVLGDWSEFVIADRIGTIISHTDWIVGNSKRPTGEHGFFAFWRTGSGTQVTNAFRVLVV